MDLLIIVLASLFILLGIIGSFIPIIPGPLTSWSGLLILSFSSSITISTFFLVLSFIIALFIFIIDNIISILGAKKFGGGKGSVIGSSIGLILGIIFLGPFGLLFGPFTGAFLGELYMNQDNKKGALRAAIGALLGFITGVSLKLMISLAFLLLLSKKFVGI